MVDDHLGRDHRVLDRLREIGATLSGCEESVLQDRPLFHVRRRRFAILQWRVIATAVPVG